MANERGRARGRGRLAAVATLAAILLTGCANTVITKTGRETSSLYNIVLVMAAVVFIAVEAAIIWQVVKYRRRRGEESRGLPPQIHGNRQIEIVWTALPSIVIAVLFVLSMIIYTRVNAEPRADLNIRVTGYQWQWRFEYLGDDGKPQVTENAEDQDHGPTLVLPTGREMHFDLISGDGVNDVIHSFFIPAFFFKRDVVPGRTNTFNDFIEPGTEGTYVGECAEFCGDFHNAMTFTVKVVSGSEFDSWLAAQAKKQAKGPQCSPSGSDVKVVAKQIQFDTDCLAAPANTPFTLTLDNQDPGVAHNVEIFTKNPSDGGTRLGGADSPSDFFPGVATKSYEVGAIKPGSYYFQCDVHPTAMFGTFVVK